MGHQCRDKDIRVKITESDLPVTFPVKFLGRKECRGLWGIKNTREPIDAMISLAKEDNLSLPLVSLCISKEGIFIYSYQSQKKHRTDVNANEVPSKVPNVFLSSIKSSVLGGKRKSNMKKPDMIPIIDADSKSIDKVETDFKLLTKLKQNGDLNSGCTFLGIDTISYGVQDLIFTRVFSIIVLSEKSTSAPFHCYAFICEDRHVARCLTYGLSAAFQVYSRTMKAMRPTIQKKKERERNAKILSIDLRTPEEKRGGRKTVDSEA